MSTDTAQPKDIFHLIPKPIWENCKESKTPYKPSTYEQDGFIHATEDPKMLLSVGNHFYKSVTEPFLLLRIDVTKLLDAPVKYEPAAPVGDTEAHSNKNVILFPHIYGLLNISCVVKEYVVLRSDEGTFLDIQGLDV